MCAVQSCLTLPPPPPPANNDTRAYKSLSGTIAVGMQVLGDKCFVNGTHTIKKKELLSGGNPAASSRERLPRHTLPYNGLISRMNYKGLKSMG